MLSCRSITYTRRSAGYLAACSRSISRILPELGARQCFIFATTLTRQRNIASVTRKNMKNGKATVLKWSSHTEYQHMSMYGNNPTITWPENMVTISWQCCIVQSKALFTHHLKGQSHVIKVWFFWSQWIEKIILIFPRKGNSSLYQRFLN